MAKFPTRIIRVWGAERLSEEAVLLEIVEHPCTDREVRTVHRMAVTEALALARELLAVAQRELEKGAAEQRKLEEEVAAAAGPSSTASSGASPTG